MKPRGRRIVCSNRKVIKKEILVYTYFKVSYVQKKGDVSTRRQLIFRKKRGGEGR